MTTSTLEDQSDREDVINYTIQEALTNPFISNTELANFFSWLSGEVLIYERAGINMIIEKCNDEITNNGVWKSFLEKDVNPTNGVSYDTVIAFLTTTLV